MGKQATIDALCVACRRNPRAKLPSGDRSFRCLSCQDQGAQSVKRRPEVEAPKARVHHTATPNEYYVTPQSVIKRFLSAWCACPDFPDVTPDWLHKALVLDPCCGGDDSHPAAYPEALCSYDVMPTRLDIRDDSWAHQVVNYLHWTAGKDQYDLVISNPPFSSVCGFVKRALEDVRDGGYVVFLQKTAWHSAAARVEFLRAHRPVAHFIHPERIKFLDRGNGDQFEYGHYIWRKGSNPRAMRTYWVTDFEDNPQGELRL